MGEFKILELFSGIGGMHAAFNYSRLKGSIVAAIDVNPVANIVYKHNYPNVQVFNNNIQKLTKEFVQKLNVNMILMSPPCQPFTRVGNKKDIADNRVDALKHICDIITDLETIDYILMENVKGFENSVAHKMYINSLQEAKFIFSEFILSPSHFGLPNTRHRYFCLARRRKFNFDENLIWENLPPGIIYNSQQSKISEIVENENQISSNLILSDEILRKRVSILDIVTPESTNSICFTKAYTHYSEGTGSIFSPLTAIELSKIFDKLKCRQKDSDEYKQLLQSLRLRYFSPREVCRLMNFPESFTFPEDTTTRQRYRLLGNSINVLVVGELIKILCT